MFAIVKIGARQYRAELGQKLRVSNLALEAGKSLVIDDVLAVGDDKAISYGKPSVKGARVTLKVLEHGKEKKVLVFKKRRRKSSKTLKGHRQQFSLVKIAGIEANGKKVNAAAEKAPIKKVKTEKASLKNETAKGVAPKSYKEPPKVKDDLKRITGIGPKLEKLLNKMGYYTFDQIANWTKENIAYVDERLQFKGRIERDNWVMKAKELVKEGMKDGA